PVPAVLGWWGKLLVVPMVESHWLSLLVALSQKGHQIVTVAQEAYLSAEASIYYTLKRYPAPLRKDELRAHV
ncbi:UD11 glucuronosyltransferase, partial [Horornis vulcanius]|nr:UD11 glucuronosyltransferase [Horornis vulcanius]